MANYGTCFASFYNADGDLLYDNGGTLSTSTGVSFVEVLYARGGSGLMQVGHGEFYIPPNDNTYPLIQVGHYASVYQQDQIGSYQAEVACFIIKDIHVEVVENVPLLKISGPEVSHELTQWLVWQDIGDQDTEQGISINTTGTYPVGTTRIAIAAGDIAAFSTGASIFIIRWDIFPIYIGEVDTVGGDYIEVTPPLYNAIPDVTEVDVQVTDYSTPTTSDITKIMTRPTVTGDWALTVEGGGNGTTNGTSHLGDGSSTLALLNAAANASGEYWRMKQRSAGNVAPLREIEWRSSSDSTGITLVMPTQANFAARFGSTSYGIIESIRREYRDERVSHVTPYGGGSGGQRLTLYRATDSAPAGYTLTRGVGSRSLLVKDSLATEFSPNQREVVVTFPWIRPGGTTDADAITAANLLLETAVNWMEARNEKLRYYEVVCVLHKNVRPGQTVALEYEDEWLDLDKTGLYITDYEHFVGDDNVRRTRLILGEQLARRNSGNDVLAGALATNGTVATTLGAGPATSSGGQSPNVNIAVRNSASNLPGVWWYPEADLGTSTARLGFLGAYIDDSGSPTIHRTALRTESTTSVDSRADVTAISPSGNDSRVTLLAQAGTAQASIELDTGDNVTIVSPADVEIRAGEGLTINQSANDGNIIELISSDVAHGITTIADTDVYSTFCKTTGADGGVLIRGLSEGTVGAQLSGFAVSASTGETTSDLGTIRLNTHKKNGTGITSWGTDDNIVVMANNSATKWILKGNGDVYIDGTQNTYDAYDDVALARALDLSTGGAIASEFDKFVQYNQEDLIAARILGSDGRMINTTQLQRLHNGAIWQLHRRIAQLEKELRNGERDTD